MSCRTQYRTPPGPPAPSIAHVANADRQQQAACQSGTILARFPAWIGSNMGNPRLLAFYDFPAEHWKHIRTTNPIESTFAAVRLRTTKTKGCLSRMTALTMVFKLCQSASKKWRRRDGSHQIADINSRRQNQGRRKAHRTRRLKPASPTFDNSSDRPNPRHCQSFELVNLTGRRSFGFHQGQRSAYRSAKAGYMTASSTAVLSQFLPCNTGGVHT